MEFKEIKKSLLRSDHTDWFKSVEIEFSSYPCNFHKKFIGIEEFYHFLKKEVSGWEDFETDDLPEPLDVSKRQISSLFDELNSNLEALIESRISSDNLAHQNANKITNIQNAIYLSKSPESFFLIDLYKTNKNSIYWANEYLSNQLRSPHWANDQNAIFGILAAYEFSSGEKSHIFSRRIAERRSFSKLRTDFDKEIEEIIQIKDSKSEELEKKIIDFEQLISDVHKRHDTEHNNSFSRIEGEHKKIHFDARKRIEELEALYTDKLMLEKPVEYWDKRAVDLKQSANKWLMCAFGSAVLGLIMFTTLAVSLSSDYISKHITNPALSIRWSILSILAIALIVFLVRTFTKLTMSSYHLYRDAQERKQLTYIYLSLKSEAQIPDSDRHIILQSLFSRSDTGLLKEDSGPTMPVSLLKKMK